MVGTANDLNISASGYVTHNGLGVFHGRTFQAGSGITLTNADGIAGNTTITATGSGGNFVINTPLILGVDYTVVQTLTIYTPTSDFILNSINLIFDNVVNDIGGNAFSLGFNGPNYDNVLSISNFSNPANGTYNQFKLANALPTFIVPAGQPIIFNLSAADTADACTGRIFLTGSLI